MKAITLWQPWASLLACGAKQYETRSWATKYRGPITIHAALKHPYHCIGNIIGETTDAMIRALSGADFRDLPRGCTLATAELVGCWEICTHMGQPALRRNDAAYKIIAGNELLFGDFTPGRFAWEFANMKLLPEPIPTKGMQGLWNWEGRL